MVDWDTPWEDEGSDPNPLHYEPDEETGNYERLGDDECAAIDEADEENRKDFPGDYE